MNPEGVEAVIPPGPVKRLILTVGFPRSGKSTWARATGYPIISADAIRLAMFDRNFVPSGEQLVWTHLHYAVPAFFLAGNDTLVLDSTSITRKRRDEWVSRRWETYIKMFNTPSAECVRRAVVGGREDLVPVIERMARQFEELTVEEAGRIWE